MLIACGCFVVDVRVGGGLFIICWLLGWLLIVLVAGLLAIWIVLLLVSVLICLRGLVMNVLVANCFDCVVVADCVLLFY